MKADVHRHARHHPAKRRERGSGDGNSDSALISFLLKPNLSVAAGSMFIEYCDGNK